MAADIGVKRGNNQTWDYAQGVPIREQITVYLMEDIFAIQPKAIPLTFNMTFYMGKSMNISRKRHGKTHRLIGIFAHGDGPDPIDIVENGSIRWGGQASIRNSFRAALKAAILDKLNVGEDVIQYLDKIIFDVTKNEPAADAVS